MNIEEQAGYLFLLAVMAVIAVDLFNLFPNKPRIRLLFKKLNTMLGIVGVLYIIYEFILVH